MESKIINFYSKMQEEQNICNMLSSQKVENEVNEGMLKLYEKYLKELQNNYKGKYKEFIIGYFKEEIKNFKKYNKERKRINKKYQEIYEMMKKGDN